MAISGTLTNRVWLLLAVLVVAGAESAAHLLTARQPPTPAEWVRLSEALLPLQEEGTLVVVEPPWAADLARYQLEGRFFPLSALARSDEHSFPSAVEVSIGGSRSAQVAGWPVSDELPSGPFTVRRLRNPQFVASRFDFVEALHPRNAVVAEIDGDEVRACRWTTGARRYAGGLGGPPAFPARRFRCRSNEFVFVGLTVIDDEEYRPRRCIWAHPPPSGFLEIRFRTVRLGSRIRGHMGIPWLPARDGLGTPVELELFVDQQKLSEFKYDEREGWRGFEVLTPNLAGQQHQVTWRVASERFEHRHFCFEARAQ